MNLMKYVYKNKILPSCWKV